MNVAIIGAGNGGKNIIKAISETKDINIVLVVDKNLEAPGILLSKELGINYSQSIEDINNYNLDLIIEATGNESITNLLIEQYCSKCKIIDSTGARLIMSLVEKNIDTLKKLNNQISIISNTSNIIKKELNEISYCTNNIDSISNILLDSTKASIKHIDETDRIIQAVNKIANQTKILGINATIEAARAGQYGKGFSVVANEVQKLADSSEKFAKEINEILLRITQEIQKTNEEVYKLKNLSKTQMDSSNKVNIAVNELIDETTM
ncbi:methyl-accepting chemotaxis protein [Tepidibacter thalassicus]|uniref:Dihydrodipicolinate reductase, N-terminus n=1 Tax=Tepidibacter thalassicus DSM 15285 TaxID=1123350 RepID=A0A1M5PGR1_9FIRM|nr:methyl-accepting chemotaxis protein [Tepidibacter thalassicus]SHH00940.1 Dihydrodipicolinate reductase, N-terminus [Tepidibacter thalassicus DSM 15285]